MPTFAITLLVMSATAAPAQAADAPPALKQLVSAGGGHGSDAGSGRYAELRKLDSRVQGLAADALDDRAPESEQKSGLQLRGDDRLLVDVYTRGRPEAIIGRLRALGMTVTGVGDHSPARSVEGWLPLDRATDVAALDGVKAVLPVAGAGTNTGSVLSQGDAAHHGPQARAFGTSGAGVTVGVISDTIDKAGSGVAGSQANGNLPASVQVLSEPGSGTDEGRAMAEIVYDTAPGLQGFIFSSGVTGGPANKAAAIANLVSAGADLIVDDTFRMEEPFFQDGQVAQAVDAAKAAGVPYIVSAGNRGQRSWDGDFTPATGGYNDFDTTAGEDTEQTVMNISNGTTVRVYLQWAEPWGAAATNLDIEGYNITGGELPVGSGGTDDNVTTTFPSETLTVVNNTGSTYALGLKIKRTAGTGTPAMKYIVTTTSSAFSVLEHPTNSGAIDPDAASATGSLAVGAVRWNDPGLDSAESFSSRGPATRRLDTAGVPLGSPDVRQKPDLAGADGVATGVGGFGNFLGTSASAPSIAGVAALVMSANPSLSVDDLYSILRDPSNTIDCSAPGNPDIDCGAGFALADYGVGTFDTTPPQLGNSTNPGQPDGDDGWYRSPVTVSWNVADSASPISSTSGCGPTTLNDANNGSFTLTCSATSVGGTSTQSRTIKHDGTPPDDPQITGISAKRFKGSTLPALKAIGCTSSDTASGIAGCKIDGYSAVSGSHTLTATATNGAGATTTSTLAYSVAPTISALKAKRVGLSAALVSGVALSVKAAEARTKVTATATATIPGSSKKLTVGRLSKTVKRGKAKLRLKLNASGQQALRKAGRARLKLVVTGKSGLATTSLRRSISVH